MYILQRWGRLGEGLTSPQFAGLGEDGKQFEGPGPLTDRGTLSIRVWLGSHGGKCASLKHSWLPLAQNQTPARS